MLRLSVVLFTTLCLLLGPVKAQGINPVSPAGGDLIQVITPSQANPSNNYTTPIRIDAGGTPPVLTGSCAVVSTTQIGGKRTGSFVIPAGNCNTTTTVILTMAIAAPNGYACDAHDLTTPTAIFDETATTTLVITFTIRAANAAAADVVVFKCQGY
jgi:hypothetical protein